MISVTSPENDLQVLIYNTDLPVFPGSAAHEFLNTTELAKRIKKIGLISLLHNQQDIEKSEIFKQHAIQPFFSPIKTHLNSISFIVKLLHSMAKIIFRIKQFFSKNPKDLIINGPLFHLMAEQFIEAFKKNHWDAIIVIQSNAASIIDYAPSSCTSFLVMHDIRSLVYQRQVKIASNKFKKYYLQREAQRYYQFEKKYCQKFDMVIALSKEDAAFIEKNYQPKHLAIVPIPIDMDYFSFPANLIEKPHRIVFTGYMAHPPNVDAAIFFAKEVFPLIRQQIKNAEFYIVGKTPVESVCKLAHLPGVSVTGTVTDTRPYLAEASVVVVPLRFGSGVRNKILESWSMEKCIISTTLGAEGLYYQDELHLKIADDINTMAAAVIKALLEPDYRHQLSLHGKKIAKNNHCPQTIGQQYFKTIQSITPIKKALHVAIDLRWMVPGLAGGIENVARSFLKELCQLDQTNQYTLLLHPKSQVDPYLLTQSNIRLYYQSYRYQLQKRLKMLGGKVLSRLNISHAYTNNLIHLQFMRELDVNMIYSLPGYIRQDLYARPNILMVPDIQHEFFPDFFPEDILQKRKSDYCQSINEARHIIAISEFTRQTLIEKLKVNPDKISTILLAADPIFSAKPEVTDQEVFTKYGLTPNTYLFFPAHTWHHKNHVAAIHALHILKQKYHLTPQLICTGGKREAQPIIEKLIIEKNLENQVRFLGYCPHTDLASLYRGALALVYPSLFEGFGMPVLEAMQSGCPVICSNKTSLPEITYDAALLSDPNHYELMADNIKDIIKNKELRQTLINKGFQQSKHFSWKKNTLETLALFKKIHQQTS